MGCMSNVRCTWSTISRSIGGGVGSRTWMDGAANCVRLHSLLWFDVAIYEVHIRCVLSLCFYLLSFPLHAANSWVHPCRQLHRVHESQAGIHMCVTADNVGVQADANLKLGNGNLRDRELFRPGGAYLFSCFSLVSHCCALYFSVETVISWARLITQ